MFSYVHTYIFACVFVRVLKLTVNTMSHVYRLETEVERRRRKK